MNPASDLIESKVKLVGFDPNKRPVVILECAERLLPIWVGPFEADAISTVLRGAAPPRPMTHDTAINIIRAFSSNLERVVIYKIEKNTFYARLYAKRHDAETNHIRVVEIDCRPSDAIALALRMSAPIFVHVDVVNAAGVNNLKVEGASEEDAAASESEPDAGA